MGEFSGRRNEGLVRMADEHACGCRCRHIDRGDVDCGAEKGDEVGACGEKLSLARCGPVRNNHLAAGSGADELAGAEIVIRRIRADLDIERLKLIEGPSVVRLEVFGIVGEEDPERHGSDGTRRGNYRWVSEDRIIAPARQARPWAS